MFNINCAVMLQNMPITVKRYSWELGGWIGYLENGVRVVVVELNPTTKRVADHEIKVSKISQFSFCQTLFSDGRKINYIKIWADKKIKVKKA